MTRYMLYYMHILCTLYFKTFGPGSSARLCLLPPQQSIGLDGPLERTEEAVTCREGLDHRPSGFAHGQKNEKGSHVTGTVVTTTV